MSSVIIEFQLQPTDVDFAGETMYVELGNGVRLTTTAPEWVRNVKSVKLQIVMEIEGAKPSEPSV